MSDENDVWSGTPSQVLNLGTFIVCGLLVWTGIPVVIAIWKWLVIKNMRYELTTERLITHQGVLTKTADELELYRVKDARFHQSFFLRLFKLANIILKTSDESHPIVIIQAIPNAKKLREEIRVLVEKRRDQKRVREVDFN